MMRKAGLNFNLSKEFLNFLIQMEIIREKKVDSKTVYILTDKGQRLYTYFGLDVMTTQYSGELEYFESISREKKTATSRFLRQLSPMAELYFR
jgi:hypothetical protein